MKPCDYRARHATCWIAYCWGRIIKSPPKKPFAGARTARQEGVGGRNAEPSEQSPQSPAVLLVRSRTPQKSFVFPLEEKIGRAQIRKCEQNFSVVWRALASGDGAGQFRSKWVRAKFRIEHRASKIYSGPSRGLFEPLRFGLIGCRISVLCLL